MKILRKFRSECSTDKICSASQSISIVTKLSVLVSAWSKPLTPTNKEIYDSFGYGIKIIINYQTGMLVLFLVWKN